jgi:AraC-like DNA-binding protein
LIAGEPVVEVALRLGFTDQPHLTRELRTLIGTTPAACRKSARRADAPVAP